MRVLCALLVWAALVAIAHGGTQSVNDLISSRLKVPRGFKIEVYVDGLPYARSMDLNADGTLLYVSSYNFNGIEGTDSILSRVYGVVDSDKDGAVDEVYNITHKVRAPNGVAVHGKDMYVALMDRILKWEDAETSMKTGPTEPTLELPTLLPNHTWHGWRYIRVHREKLYIAIGAPCNIPCDDWCDCLVNPIFGTIQELGLDGLNMKPVAKGIRNSVGIAFHPQTEEMWFTDNGRDAWDPNHSERPPDEINVVTGDSETDDDGVPHFGYPYCYGTAIPDPHFNTGDDCSNYTGAVVETATHSATLGMRFYFSDHFPAKYNGSIFFAEHGSWNSQPPHGFEVNRAYWNVATQKWERENFMSGWINSADPEKCTVDDDCPGIATCQNNPELYEAPFYCGGWGRPADVEVLQDGSLLVSDETNHLVYRITYVGEDDNSGNNDLTWTIALVVGGVCVLVALVLVLRAVAKNKKNTDQYAPMGGSPPRSTN